MSQDNTEEQAYDMDSTIEYIIKDLEYEEQLKLIREQRKDYRKDFRSNNNIPPERVISQVRAALEGKLDIELVSGIFETARGKVD
jgi:hypothetical protein